jgi:hypothetical protein
MYGMLKGTRVCFRAWLFAIPTLILVGQSQQWKNEHEKDNRWEGLIGEEQGGLDWEIRSFLGDAVEKYPMNLNKDLTLKWYVPDAARAFVTGQEVNPALYYLMLPKPRFLNDTPGWRSFTNWRTVDVLLNNKIDSTQLGVLIRLGDDNVGNTRLAPGLIYFSKPPTKVQTYHLDIFTMRAIRAFRFEVRSENYHKFYPVGPYGNRSIISLAARGSSQCFSDGA